MTNDASQTALITGASSGIGAAFARELAARGYNLVLTARREAQLVDLATELQQQYAIKAEVLVADLTKVADVERVEQYIRDHKSLTLLINNAGFGTNTKFSEADINVQLNMIEVHIIATVRFSRAVLPQMIARKQGGIINVSSLSAFNPFGHVSYCATKAYLVTFSEVLQTELRGTGVQVQALCPGFTTTQFHDTPAYKTFSRGQVPGPFWMTAERVVTISLDSLSRWGVICVPGYLNRIVVALARSSLFRAVAIRLYG